MSLKIQHRRPVVVDVDVADVPLERVAAGVDVEVPVHDLLDPLEGLEVLFHSRAELELVLSDRCTRTATGVRRDGKEIVPTNHQVGAI